MDYVELTYRVQFGFLEASFLQNTNHSDKKAPETGHNSQPAAKGNESAQPNKQGPPNKPGAQSQNQNQKNNNQKNNQGAKGPGKPPIPKVVEVPPAAGPTRAKKRHWGLLLSFLLLVLVPLAVVIFYLFAVAKDQYSSITGFTVRSEEAGGASDILGGLAQFAGQSTGTDSDVLYEFIQSQEIVARIDEDLDLRAHYSANWSSDPVFSLWPDASVEDLTWYWQRVVRLSYDASSGLIDVQVLAFDRDTAKAVAEGIVRESQDMINALNTQAREDAMRYANEDLEEAVDRLKDAREALTRFRTRTQIVDPAADIQGRMGVLNNLQQQLAQALIEHDLLL